MKTHKPQNLLNALAMVLITTLSLTTCLLVNGDVTTSSTVDDTVSSPDMAPVTESADGTGGPMSARQSLESADGTGGPMSTPEPMESADGTGGPMSTPEPMESADGTGSPDAAPSAAMADGCEADDSSDDSADGCNDMPEASD